MVKDYSYIIGNKNLYFCQTNDSEFDITDEKFNIKHSLKIERSTIERNKDLFRNLSLDINGNKIKLRASRAYDRKYLQYILISNEYNVVIDNIKSIEFIDGDSFNFCISNLKYSLFNESIEKIYVSKSSLNSSMILHVLIKDRVNGYNIVYYDLVEYVIIEFINSKTRKVIQSKIDFDIYEKIKDYRLTPKLNNSGSYYIDIALDGGEYDKLHRYISKPDDGLQVDHIDRDTLNNLNSNLRNVTPQTNCQNRGVFKNNISGVNGVSFNASNNSWEACITVNNIKKSKSFNINKLGNTNAFKKACEYRKELEKIYEYNSDI